MEYEREAFGHNPKPPIDCLELMGGAFAVKAFTQHKTQVRVLFSAVTHINKMGDGGTRSPILSSLAFELWAWCLQRQTSIIARHIPGTQNLQEDQESRPFRLETQTRDFSMYFETLGSYRNRSLCIPPVVPDRKVLKLETRPRGGSSGRFYQLDSIEGVCHSPFRISREMSKASHSTSSEIGYNSSSMGNPTLVSAASPTL